MTQYISTVNNHSFFEQFDSTNITAHENDIEQCNLISSDKCVALELPGNGWIRIIRWGTSFSLTENAQSIVDVAKTRLSLVFEASVHDHERLITTCQAASRTCLFIDRIIKKALAENKTDPKLKELHEALEEHGIAFLKREADLRQQHCISVACKNKTLHAAIELIKEEGTLDAAVGYYTELLALAFEQEEYKLCRLLIDKGADLKQAFKEKVQPYASLLLSFAIKDGQENVALMLVDAGADLHKMKDGKYPLHLACAAGFTRLVEKMIIHGVNLASVDRLGNTALHEASRALNAPLALLLMQNGVDVSRVNQEIDGASKVIKQGACAFRLPLFLKDKKEEVFAFYRAILQTYAIPQEILLHGGIEAFLSDCAAHPDTLIHRQGNPNPFEIALLFQDPLIAKNVALRMPLSDFFDFVKKLKKKYPTSSFDLIEFCYNTVSDAHFKKDLPQFNLHAPIRDVQLDDIMSFSQALEINNRLYTTKEVDAHLRSFVARIQGKASMCNLLNTEEAKNSFYQLLEICLKNIIITFQDSPVTPILQRKKELFVTEIVDLETQEGCAGRYFGVCTKLYRSISKESPDTVETEILMLLAEHREMLLKQCLDPIKSKHNDYNFLLPRIGKELALPGQDTANYYKSIGGQCDIEAAKANFVKLYTPASIIKDCISPALEQSQELQERVCEWLFTKLPSSWGQTVGKTLQSLQSNPATTEEQIREFLHKNGVHIDVTANNFEEAVTATRRRVYLEREVYENGKISSLAISRLLASFEKPVFVSDKLQYEGSPTTFASNSFDDIIDMV